MTCGEEVTGGRSLLSTKKLHVFSLTRAIFRVFKLRMMRWVKHVACMEELRNAYEILVGIPQRNFAYRMRDQEDMGG
jgi:hypothetical protein